MGWVAVPREVFEYEMIPQRIHEVFLQRGSVTAVTPAQLQAIGYPRLPDQDELEAAYEQQRMAVLNGDERLIHEAHQRVEQLERQVEAARQAVDVWRRADPRQLEEQIALELARAPHADVLVGIPVEIQRA